MNSNNLHETAACASRIGNRLRRELIDRGGLAFLGGMTAMIAVAVLATPRANAAACCPPANGNESRAGGQVPAEGGGCTRAKTATEPGNPIPRRVATVMEHYVKIQTALAADTTDGVSDAAAAIAKLVAEDPGKTLPVGVVAQAEALGKASDLAAAREALKPLSVSLSRYLSTEKIKTGLYHQMFCSMANAGWIQADRVIRNPYYGKSMLECGEVMGTY